MINTIYKFHNVKLFSVLFCSVLMCYMAVMVSVYGKTVDLLKKQHKLVSAPSPDTLQPDITDCLHQVSIRIFKSEHVGLLSFFSSLFNMLLMCLLIALYHTLYATSYFVVYSTKYTFSFFYFILQ